MQRASIVSVLALLALAGSASADVIATDVFVPAGGIGSAGIGLGAGTRYTFFNFGTNDDTVMRILDPGAVEVVNDDDNGPNVSSGFSFVAGATGAYNIQLSRFPDFAFAGNAGSAFTNRLVGCNGATGAESGSNNTHLTADAAIYGSAGFAMSGSLSAGDVDYFSFTGSAGEVIGAYTDLGFDSVLGLFDSTGTLLSSDDDGGPGTASSMQFTLPASGTYYFAVTAFADFAFTGNHSTSGDYLLIVAGGAAVPAPGAAALLGALGLAGLRRRRR